MKNRVLVNKYVKELAEQKLVGFRIQCPGDQYVREIPKASKMLDIRIGEIKQVINTELQVGAFVVEERSSEEDGYWVCVEVQDFEDVPADMVTLTVPPQKYAALKYEGPNHKIMAAYETLHMWIDENNFLRLRDKWHLEIFHSWKNPENIEVELLDTVG